LRFAGLQSEIFMCPATGQPRMSGDAWQSDKIVSRETFLSGRAAFPDMKLAPSSCNQPGACPMQRPSFSFDFRR
jgi:hypothetical protein